MNTQLTKLDKLIDGCQFADGTLAIDQKNMELSFFHVICVCQRWFADFSIRCLCYFFGLKAHPQKPSNILNFKWRF